MKDNPGMPKDVAYPIAVQQGHKVGKTPKDFRTAQGVREAKQKYDEPKSEYQKSAGILRPKQPRAREIVEGRGPAKRAERNALRDKLREGCPSIKTAMWAAFFDELEKIGEAQPGSLLGQRGALSATSTKAKASVDQLSSGGGVGSGGAATGAAAVPATPPPSPPSPTPASSGMVGGLSGGDMPGTLGAGDMPAANPADAGGSKMPGGAPGAMPSGLDANEMPGASAPSAPPPPSPGSLLSPQRQKVPGTGKLTSAESAEVAPPSATEFGGGGL